MIGATGLITARFFGHFTCSVNDSPIVWARRMDRRIFRYLLLVPEGRAPREEILAAFWPDQDAKSSQLSLRTACSNIRKALGSVVGTDAADEYFSAASETLFVNLGRVNVDVRRYIAHLRNANAAYLADEFQEAALHYGHALALYTAPIGWGEEPEAWIEPLAKECANLREIALERMVRILRKNGATMKAMEYESLLANGGGLVTA